MSKGAVDRLREMREEKAAREEARQKADRATTIQRLRGDVAKTAAKKAKPKKGKRK